MPKEVRKVNEILKDKPGYVAMIFLIFVLLYSQYSSSQRDRYFHEYSRRLSHYCQILNDYESFTKLYPESNFLIGANGNFAISMEFQNDILLSFDNLYLGMSMDNLLNEINATIGENPGMEVNTIDLYKNDGNGNVTGAFVDGTLDTGDGEILPIKRNVKSDIDNEYEELKLITLTSETYLGQPIVIAQFVVRVFEEGSSVLENSIIASSEYPYFAGNGDFYVPNFMSLSIGSNGAVNLWNPNIPSSSIGFSVDYNNLAKEFSECEEG